MLPWELVDSAKTPDGELISLHRRGTEFSIRVGNEQLMDSFVHGSEDALAKLACTPIANRPKARVLIGGLGLGYTVAAALKQLGTDAEVVVSELIPAVTRWNRGPLAALAGHPLNDRRVTVREGDVAHILRAEKAGFDAIMMDVDNGPDALTQGGNSWLYGKSGLRAAHAALRPKGIYAVWSAYPSRPFTRRLNQTGFRVEEVGARSHGARKGSHHIIWVAQRGA
ncbi:MAG: hypothetical protein HN849_31790 [Victivallales bacterium]|nr:hypothetical protein [Victivallales bacterium]MBT7304158.1 hypothetical protein [Victivallales bacterium]